MYGTPVADGNAIESPVAFENIEQQHRVFASVVAVIFVVARHNGPCLAFGDGSFEARQVYFVKSAVVDKHIYAVACHLLIVERIVLNTSRHAVLLHALHIRHHHSGGEQWVFAHIFEISATERRTVDVYAGAQEHVFVAITGLFAYRFAIE